MSDGQNILVEEGEVNGDIGYGVTLTMPRERAVLLFHDINRLLGLIDEVCPNLQDGRHPEAGDQGAYDRTNEVLAQLQRELQIEPQ